MSTNALAVTPAPAAPAVGSGQYLTFRLGPEEYGIEILKVQEIKGFTAVTPIPNTPPYVKGVMNLRGTVVPVLDLRTKFGMPETPYDKFTVIVVVTVGARVLGMVVDSVSDVLDIAPGAIEAIPDLGAGIDTTCLSGMAKSGDKLVLLLDLARVVTFDALPAGT
jgi:purine-binding chemotaxis protein CheW